MPITLEWVRQVASSLEKGDSAEFFAHVPDDVDWTVQGTHPLAGHYRSKADFREHTLAKLAKVLPQRPQLRVVNVLVSGDWPWSNSGRRRPRRAVSGSTTGIAG
jgi:uncharacterized protein